MKNTLFIIGLFSIFSCEQKTPATIAEPQALDDSKFFMQDKLTLRNIPVEEVGQRLTDYIETVYNKDKKKPAVNNISVYVENSSVGNISSALLLTNFVNEQSRKAEFDNLVLYTFIQKNFGPPEHGFGGSRKDVEAAGYRMTFRKDFVFLPVDSSWVIEDSGKVSLFHNDLAIAEKIPVHGFDKDGEPEIRIMKDGSLFIVFNFMPPSNGGKDTGGELGPFKDFDAYLSKQLGEKVEWIDREIFMIKDPKKETAARIKQLLEGYWLKK